MKSILVIGGSGYVGTVLIPALLKENYKIYNIDNLLYRQKDFNSSLIKIKKYKKNYYHINADLRDVKKLKLDLINFDFVIILAGIVGDPITKKYPHLSKEINRYGIKNLISFFKKKSLRLIFVSTCSNYGTLKSKKKKATEKTELKPLSLYAKDKVYIENYLKKNKKKFNFTYIILRFATAFGLSPRMRFDLTLSDFVHQMYFKKKIKVYDANTWRPYCHVKDFARVILAIIKLKTSKIDNEIFNVGSDKNNFTKKNIIKSILSEGIKSEVSYLKNDIDHRNYRVNFSKIRKKLNFVNKFDLKFGIKELKKSFKKGNYKIINNMGNYKISI